jgi:hypothetical protein
MPHSIRVFAIIFLSLILIIHCQPANCAPAGIKTYMPTVTNASIQKVPFTYNSSFVVHNNGFRDNVYIVKVAVEDPVAISWIKLSDTVFVLSPGESKVVYFNISIINFDLLPGTYQYLFIPALLPQNMEPYMDPFANYVSVIDKFRFDLIMPEGGAFSTASTIEPPPSVKADIPGRINLIQNPALYDKNIITTQINKAIRLNSPETAEIGRDTGISISIFEGEDSEGIYILAASPDGYVYPVKNNTFSFNREGRWSLIVLIGEEILLGKPITVVKSGGIFSTNDNSTAFLALLLLFFMLAVPLWLMSRKPSLKTEKDPYSELRFKAYVIKKYIRSFDKGRLKRTIEILYDEYYEMARRGYKGKKDDALNSLEELKKLSENES